MSEYPYIFKWGNNEARARLKGRKCRIVKRMTRNSADVEFENGERQIISRNALRKVKNAK